MIKNYSSEEIINSLDGASRAEPSPFLFTRIQSRLNVEKNSIYTLFSRLLTHPTFAVGLAVLFILINGLILVGKINDKNELQESSQPLAVEYIQPVINPYETNDTPE